MKRFLRDNLPKPESITGNKYLRFLTPWLGHPRLWHMHRRGVALGIAIGLVTGLIPGPVQMLAALLIAVPLRANILAAMFATWYTNPLTFVPLYLLAYQIGALVTGEHGNMLPPPEFNWTLNDIWNVLPAVPLVYLAGRYAADRPRHPGNHQRHPRLFRHAHHLALRDLENVEESPTPIGAKERPQTRSGQTMTPDYWQEACRDLSKRCKLMRGLVQQ